MCTQGIDVARGELHRGGGRWFNRWEDRRLCFPHAHMALTRAMPPIHGLGNWVFAARVSSMVRRQIADAFSGLEAMPRSMLLAAELSGCQWRDLGPILAAAKHGLRFVALPVAYCPRVSRASKMKLSRSASIVGAICLRRTLESMPETPRGRRGHAA